MVQKSFEEGSVFLKLLLFILVIIFLFGTFLYFSKRSDNTKTSVLPSIQPTEQANVKEYTNSQYGYSLNYPSSWGATTTLVDSGVVLFSNPEYLKMRLSDPGNFNKEDYATIESGVYSNGVKTAWGSVTADTDPKDFALKLNQNTGVVSASPISVGNKTGIEFRTYRTVLKPGIPFGIQNCPPDKAPCEVKEGTQKQVWVKLPNGLLYIKYSYGRGYTDIQMVEKTFNDIVKSVTFK